MTEDYEPTATTARRTKNSNIVNAKLQSIHTLGVGAGEGEFFEAAGHLGRAAIFRRPLSPASDGAPLQTCQRSTKRRVRSLCIPGAPRVSKVACRNSAIIMVKMNLHFRAIKLELSAASMSREIIS